MTAAARPAAITSGTPQSNDPYTNGGNLQGVVAFHRERETAKPALRAAAPRVDIFRGIAQEEMSRIMRCARTLRKARGEFIYLLGERADSVYVLKEGRVKLSVLAESGKEIAIDIIRPGEIFGEFALIDESLRSNMTQALDDVTMWVFNKRDFEELLSQTKLAMNYIRMVGDRRRRMEKKLSDITSKDVTARVCEMLHELSASSSDIDAARECLVPLTHYDVASLIGASRQTTTSVLNQLERVGIIELGRGWIRVKRMKELQRCAALVIAAAAEFFSYFCQLADIPSSFFLA